MATNQRCTICVDLNREKHGPLWCRKLHTAEGLVFCEACVRRYQDSEHARTHKAAVSTDKKKLYELDFQASQHMKFVLGEQVLQNEVHEICSRECRKMAFLTIPRDCLPGDVTFVVQGREIEAHKIVLAAKSSVFRKLFEKPSESETLEEPPEVIKMDGDCYSSMDAIINFCYTGEIYFEALPEIEVLKIANKYKISHLQDRCARHFEERRNNDARVDN